VVKLLKYVFKRLIQGFATILISTLVIFTIVNLAPGDPIIFITGGGEPPPPEIINQLRKDYGLDRSIPERLAIYLSKIFTGDLGYSYIYRTGVADLILQRLPATIILAVSTYIIITILGIVIGIQAAKRPLSLLDRFITIMSVSLFSFPSFFIAQLLILLFSIGLGLLPTGGFLDPRTPAEPIPIIIDLIKHIILPLTSLTLIHLGFMIRVSRTAIAEALGEDYIVILRAIGLPEKKVLLSASRVDAMPILTMANYELAFLLSGALLVEVVYNWPGIGTLLYDSILKRDYPMISGIFFIIIGFSVVINLITDLVYVFLDPRIGIGKKTEV